MWLIFEVVSLFRDCGKCGKRLGIGSQWVRIAPYGNDPAYWFHYNCLGHDELIWYLSAGDARLEGE